MIESSIPDPSGELHCSIAEFRPGEFSYVYGACEELDSKVAQLEERA